MTSPAGVMSVATKERRARRSCRATADPTVPVSSARRATVSPVAPSAIV